MITHVIRMSVRPEVSEEQVATALGAMAQASAELGEGTGVTAGMFGRDLGGPFDFAAVSTLATVEDYEAMMNHPAHLAVDRIGLPLVDRFHSIDIVDDADPRVPERLAAIHRRRFEEHPDLLALVRGIADYQGSGVPR